MAFASYESLRSRGMPIGKHIPDAGYFQEPCEDGAAGASINALASPIVPLRFQLNNLAA